MDSHDRGKKLAKFNKDSNFEISKIGGENARKNAKLKIKEIEENTNYCYLNDLSKKYKTTVSNMKLILEFLGYDDFKNFFGTYIFVPKEYEQIYLNYLKISKPNGSFGENIINNYLYKWGLKYQREKTFNDCIYKKYLRFDFYIKDFNLCIEVDGDGHRKIINRGKDNEKSKQLFEDCKIRDEIKNKYCKEHKINLIRLEWNGDIKYLIKQFTFKIKPYVENNIFYIDVIY